MASNTTTTTPNIHLSQYAANDVTSYLTNYNSDMLAIDTAVGELQAKETDITQLKSRMSTAEGNISTNTESIESLETEYESMVTKVEGLETQLGQVSSTASQAKQSAESASQTAAQNTLDVNTLKKTPVYFNELWRNNSPGSEFTPQDIVVENLSSFPFLLLVYRLGTTYQNNSSLFIGTSGSYTVTNRNDELKLSSRRFQITGATNTISITDCTTLNSYGTSGEVNNNSLIPYLIFGITVSESL